MTKSGLVMLLLSAAVCSVSAGPCKSIDGLEPLLRPNTVLILGELHGTVESPAFALDVACHAVSAGLPVVVGLEQPAQGQDRVDRFLSSEGGAEDRSALLSGAFWQAGYQDGRASEAMFTLIDGLRRLRPDKAAVQVTLFDPGGAGGGQARDRGMASNLERTITASPDAFFIVLTGNWHSRTTIGSPRNRDFEPMGYSLSREASGAKVIALDVAHGGGSAWICTPDCGITELSGRHGEAVWSIEIDEATRPAGHQGWYYVGGITASPPATSERHAVQPPKSKPKAQVAAVREKPAVPEKGPAAGGLRAPGKDLKIKGSWQAHDFSSMARTWKMDFEGANFRADAGGDDWYVGEITVHPEEEPAWIDFLIRDCRCSFKDMTSQGIYFWDGDSLVISAPRPGNARPQGFVESTGEMMRLLRLVE